MVPIEGENEGNPMSCMAKRSSAPATIKASAHRLAGPLGPTVRRRQQRSEPHVGRAREGTDWQFLVLLALLLRPAASAPTNPKIGRVDLLRLGTSS